MRLQYDTCDTIVAIASARGGAARGIVRVAGPDAPGYLASHWIGADDDFIRPEAKQRARCVTGEWKLPDHRRLPCQVYFWPNERSYTRQPTAEIHTLGCEPLLAVVVHQICEAGARLAAPGEFTLRAFLAGRIDLPQAEAVLGVIDSDTSQQLAISLEQLAGGLSNPLHHLKQELINLCAEVEAGLDFVDEHIEFVSSEQILQSLARIEQSVVELRGQIGSRDRSTTLPAVVLRGRPNVGKSTLWNRLLDGDQATAIVSETPGTTRDYLEARLSIDDVSCRLIDTAGIDETFSSPVDVQSQQLSDDAFDRADLVVLCIDGSRPIHRWEVDCLQTHRDDLIVVNKIDRLAPDFANSFADAAFPITRTASGWHGTTGARSSAPIELLGVSAKTGDGLDTVQQRLKQRLQQQRMDSMKLCASTAIRCDSCLRRTVAAIQRAQEVVTADLGEELLAAELREAVNGLAEVLGEVYSDDILDRVFSRFCIGK